MAKNPSKWTTPARKNLCEMIASYIETHEPVSVYEVAKHTGMTRASLISLSLRYPEDIGQSYSGIKEVVEQNIFKGGLTNEYNASMAKFALSANFGWSERSTVDQNIEISDTEITVNFSDR